MGFFDFLKKESSSTTKRGPSLQHVMQAKSQMLSLNPTGLGFPIDDGCGNGIANIFEVNVSGITHPQGKDNPQKIIPHLHNPDPVVLVPDPDNDYDSEAIIVMTADLKRIGWVPKDHIRKPFLFRRLMEGYHICAVVYQVGKRESVGWWCTIKVATYGTPFEPSMEEKNKLAKQVDLEKRLELALNLARAREQRLAGEEKAYVDAIKEILSNIPHSERVLQYVTYRDEDQYFIICCLDINILRLKLYGRKQYWLFPLHFAEFNRQYPESRFKCEPPIQKEGTHCCRLFISQASDLFEFSDIIKHNFLGYINSKYTSYAGAFPELSNNP